MPIDSGQVKEINLGDRKKHTKTEFIKSFKPLNSNSSQTPLKGLCFALKGHLFKSKGSNPNLVSRVLQRGFATWNSLDPAIQPSIIKLN
jgi:hypothetical protein